jgi:type I restriction enzyme M protein
MTTKRETLELLTRDELLAAVDRFQLNVADRRAKAGLVDAVASSKMATIPEVLADVSRDRLKELCRALGLDDSGREKAALLERLSGTKLGDAAPTTSGAKTNGAKASPPPPEVP